MPVEVLGLTGVPSAGDVLTVVENEARAREVALYRKETDAGLKRQLLNRIAASDSDAALELIDQTLQR